MMPDVTPQELLAVGRIARAHGVRGRILLVPYNSESESLTRVPALWLRGGEDQPTRFEISRAERVAQGYLIAFRGIDDRDAAAELRGREALIERAWLPVPEEGEVYAADLIGFTVVDQSGAQRGFVVDLETAGLQELLRVRDAGRDALVPLALLKEIDEAQRRILVEVPEGLFELEE
jgi:16S rRNA processing protein RimM